MMSETKSSESLSNDFYSSDEGFLLEPIINNTYIIEVCSVRKFSVSFGINFLEAI